jgi:hypothetical protein
MRRTVNTDTFDESLLITKFDRPDKIIHECEYGVCVKYKKWVELEARRIRKTGVVIVKNEKGQVALARKQ